MLVGDALIEHKRIMHNPIDVVAEPCCPQCCDCDGPESASFRIETVDGSHVEAIRNLLTANGWSGGAVPNRELLELAGSTDQAFVTVHDDVVIGFVRVITDGETVSYVCELVVHERWRRHGIARTLIDVAMSAFPSARLDLLSTVMARPFYESVGFAPHIGYRRWP